MTQTDSTSKRTQYNLTDAMYGKIDKLGIVVVYLVSERNEKLLDLHLRQIEKNTDVPYTIYGSVNRLLSRFLPYLEHDPHVKICKCEQFDIPVSWSDKDTLARECRYEQTFYLEQLIRIAVDDGCSHVAILHADSFPIRRGWAGALASKLSDKCVLAAIVRDEKTDLKPLTACIFFHSHFYLRFKPRLLPSKEELSSPEYKRYLAKFPHSNDCGSGYGFKMFVEGLSWYPMFRSNIRTIYPHFAGIYDGLIFHLSAAAFVDATGDVGWPPRRMASPIRRFVKRVMVSLLGEGTRRKITDRIPQKMRRPDRYREIVGWEREREHLLDDPESYLESLRTSGQAD